MNWVLDNVQVLVVIAVAVVAILQKLKKIRPPAAGPAPAAEDPEQAERTRRIQDEIRRRIMERRGQMPGWLMGPEAELQPEPAAEPPPIPAPPPLIEDARPVVAVPEVPVMVLQSDDQREMERQRLQLVELRMWEAGAPVRPGGEPMPAAGAGPGAKESGKRAPLRADLRNPAALRRAVVLREILGPPVALQ
jgi:hypothetical protein